MFDNHEGLFGQEAWLPNGVQEFQLLRVCVGRISEEKIVWSFPPISSVKKEVRRGGSHLRLIEESTGREIFSHELHGLGVRLYESYQICSTA